MSVIVACQCDGLPPHSHVGAQVTVRFANGREGTIPAEAVTMNPDAGMTVLAEHPPSIRVWIDWKAVARALMAPDIGGTDG